MTSHSISAKDVNTLTFLTNLVAGLFPPPISGAVHLGRRLNEQGSIEYRAIVMGYVESNSMEMRSLTEMQVANSRSEVLLQLLEAVEDFADGQFQDMDKKPEEIEETETQEEEENANHGAMKEGRQKTDVELDHDGASCSSAMGEDIEMRGFGDDGYDSDDSYDSDMEEMLNSSLTVIKKGRITHAGYRGDGKAYMGTPQSANSEVADANYEAGKVLHQGTDKGKGKARATGPRATDSSTRKTNLFDA